MGSEGMELDTRPIWVPGESEFGGGYDAPVLCQCRVVAVHGTLYSRPTCHPQRHISSTRKRIGDGAMLGPAPPTRAKRRCPPFWTLRRSTGRTRDRCEPRGWALGFGSGGAFSWATALSRRWLAWLAVCSWARIHCWLATAAAGM